MQPDGRTGGRDRFDTAEPVGEVLRRWLRRSDLLRVSDRDRIWQAWQALVGPDAAHTRLAGLHKHVVTFAVDSSPLLSELNNFRKQELLEGLREAVRSYFVRDIRFRLDKRRPASPGADHGPAAAGGEARTDRPAGPQTGPAAPAPPPARPGRRSRPDQANGRQR